MKLKDDNFVQKGLSQVAICQVQHQALWQPRGRVVLAANAFKIRPAFYVRRRSVATKVADCKVSQLQWQINPLTGDDD